MRASMHLIKLLLIVRQGCSSHQVEGNWICMRWAAHQRSAACVQESTLQLRVCQGFNSHQFQGPGYMGGGHQIKCLLQPWHTCIRPMIRWWRRLDLYEVGNRSVFSCMCVKAATAFKLREAGSA